MVPNDSLRHGGQVVKKPHLLPSIEDRQNEPARQMVDLKVKNQSLF
jgi:hypothetical protein